MFLNLLSSFSTSSNWLSTVAMLYLSQIILVVSYSIILTMSLISEQERKIERERSRELTPLHPNLDHPHCHHVVIPFCCQCPSLHLYQSQCCAEWCVPRVLYYVNDGYFHHCWQSTWHQWLQHHYFQPHHVHYYSVPRHSHPSNAVGVAPVRMLWLLLRARERMANSRNESYSSIFATILWWFLITTSMGATWHTIIALFSLLHFLCIIF